MKIRSGAMSVGADPELSSFGHMCGRAREDHHRRGRLDPFGAGDGGAARRLVSLHGALLFLRSDNARKLVSQRMQG